MTDAPIFTLSRQAAVRGGAKAGQYLDAIGQTDLGKLSPAQFEQFCWRLVGGAFSAALDDHITAMEREPPF